LARIGSCSHSGSSWLLIARRPKPDTLERDTSQCGIFTPAALGASIGLKQRLDVSDRTLQIHER
jgi:hypothetical protein